MTDDVITIGEVQYEPALLCDMVPMMRAYQRAYPDTKTIYRKIAKHVGWLARHEDEFMDYLKIIIVDFEKNYPANFVEMMRLLHEYERAHPDQLRPIHRGMVKHFGFLARHEQAFKEYLLCLGIIPCTPETLPDALQFLESLVVEAKI